MKKYLNWNSLLVVLPVLCLIFCILPGTVETTRVVEGKTEVIISAIVWGAPEGTTLSYCGYLFPLLLAYLIGAGILYYKNEGDGMGVVIVVKDHSDVVLHSILWVASKRTLITHWNTKLCVGIDIAIMDF